MNSLYDKLTPGLKIEFELFLAEIRGEKLDLGALKARYLKRSRKNTGKGFRKEMKYAIGTTIGHNFEKVGDKWKMYYRLSGDPHYRASLEGTLQALGFIKIKPKRYEILVKD